MVHVKLDAGKWQLVQNSKFHRRITAAYPEIALTGPAASVLKSAVGSLVSVR